MVRWFLALGLLVGLAVSGGMSAEAVTVQDGLTANTLNSISDQDFESYVDANADGLFNVGDVLIGIVRIDDFLPSALDANNQVYAVFAQEISAITMVGSNFFVSSTASTVPGLTLAEITGDANATGGMVAIYDSPAPYSVNLITTPPGGATSIKDYIDFILATGTLELVLDDSAPDDYFTTQQLSTLFTPGGENDPIATVPTSVTVSAFTGGLSVIFNNTTFGFADAVVTDDPLQAGLQINQIGIANGAARGMVGDGNEAIWANIGTGYGTFTQCSTTSPGPGGSTPCGFVTDADFLAFPTQVPVPASLLLLGAGLLGIAGTGYLRRR